MGMVVRTNTMSTNAYRQLGTNNTQLAKSLEKLSSGYRINRAGDDASGLAISEKMKAQIQGLTQASANSQDGISLVQTAEGALTEVHSMLNRMVSLATKSANGTIQDNVDRDAIQTEVDSLNTEITRIGKSTNFNGINLLDGSLNAGNAGGTNTAVFSATGFAATGAGAINGVTVSGAPVGTAVKFVTENADDTSSASWSASTLTISIGNKSGAQTLDQTDIDSLIKNAGGTVPTGASSFKIDLGGQKLTTTSNAADATGTTIAISAAKNASATKNNVTITATKAGAQYNTTNTVTASAAGAEGIVVTGKSFAMTLKDTTSYSANEINDILKKGGADYQVSFDGTQSGTNLAAALNSTGLSGGSGIPGGGLVLQVGDSNDSYNKVTVNVADLTAEGLGTAGLDVSSQTAAGNSIQTIKDAINTVSTNRGNLGALQNRLEYAINSMDTTTENMDAANSRIRDTDMAKEMMNYTKMNILSQAAQAMLAQANQNPQSILQLLQ